MSANQGERTAREGWFSRVARFLFECGNENKGQWACNEDRRKHKCFLCGESDGEMESVSRSGCDGEGVWFESIYYHEMCYHTATMAEPEYLNDRIVGILKYIQGIRNANDLKRMCRNAYLASKSNS